MSSPWKELGLKSQPNRAEDIHAAYEQAKDSLTRQGDLMAQLGLEDAYLNALALWEKDDDYCDKAVKTDQVFDEMMEAHKPDEPLSTLELQEIATHVMRTLHNPWQRNSIAAWKKLFEYDPIDCPQDRQFEDVLREAFLRFFGYYDGKGARRNKGGGPRVMQSKTAQYIFAKAGWIDQKPRSEKEKRELKWLADELDVEAGKLEQLKAGSRDFLFVVLTLITALVLFYSVMFWVKGQN